MYSGSLMCPALVKLRKTVSVEICLSSNLFATTLGSSFSLTTDFDLLGDALMSLSHQFVCYCKDILQCLLANASTKSSSCKCSGTFAADSATSLASDLLFSPKQYFFPLLLSKKEEKFKWSNLLRMNESLRLDMLRFSLLCEMYILLGRVSMHTSSLPATNETRF